MGKLRLFGHNWKVDKNEGTGGSSVNWGDREIFIDYYRGADGVAGHNFFHELIEFAMEEAGARFFCRGELRFLLDHNTMDVMAKILYNSLADNGLISEKKIRKLIEEK